MYKKIIVRNKVLHLGYVISASINFFHEPLEELLPASIKGISTQTILKELFQDEIETHDIPSSKLYQKYLSAKSGLVDNAVPDDEWGILASLIPWHYVDSCRFLGDTGWETDDEILENMNKMPVIEFLKHYKGYWR